MAVTLSDVRVDGLFSHHPAPTTARLQHSISELPLPFSYLIYGYLSLRANGNACYKCRVGPYGPDMENSIQPFIYKSLTVPPLISLICPSLSSPD